MVAGYNDPAGQAGVEMPEQPEAEGFNHEEHMKKVEEGLQQILASEDINEIKQIAQGLLSEEETEEAAEGEQPESEPKLSKKDAFKAAIAKTVTE